MSPHHRRNRVRRRPLRPARGRALPAGFAKQESVRTLETPEGHAVDYDVAGNVIGMVLLNVRWTLERDGAITLTWPAERLDADQLAPALAA
jgi:hypothetical protein